LMEGNIAVTSKNSIVFDEADFEEDQGKRRPRL
jgi:hypothetical protein